MPVDTRRVLEIAKANALTETVLADDPAMVRHSRELHGTPADADPTPPADRFVPKGKVLVEWLGGVSPFSSEEIAALNRMKRIPQDLAKSLLIVAIKTNPRIDGVNWRTFTNERDGMSETITWGPLNYVRELSAKDADHVLSGPHGNEFRIVGYAGEQPIRDPIELYLPPTLRPLARSVEIRIGPEEKLTGVDTATRNRMGTWEPTATSGM